jgi:pyruvate dehydrogenase (quinone)
MSTAADYLVDALTHAGVKRIYGVVGDSLNGISDSLRRSGEIDWIHVRHEEGAAFAAGAEAHLTGDLAVCAGSCGPGNLHLINGLFDCHRSGVPVLAIAAHIPSSEIGIDYFQATHPESLFKECSHYVELVSNVGQLPQILTRAMRVAVGRRGVAVVVIPGDVALSPTTAKVAPWLIPSKPPVLRPADDEIAQLAGMLQAASRVTLMCGAGCAGAHDEVVELAKRLKAPDRALAARQGVHRIRQPVRRRHDGHGGVRLGLRRDEGVRHAAASRHRFSVPAVLSGRREDRADRRASRSARQPLPARSWPARRRSRTRSPRCCRSSTKRPTRRISTARSRITGRRAADLDALAESNPSSTTIHPQYVTRLVSELAADDAIFTCDVGTPIAWAARYLKLNGRRRLVGSFNHGSMANAMLHAIGAQAAYPGRQVISMSGDGGFTMMMGDFITLVQAGLPVKVIVLNNGTLGFVEIEMRASGFVDTGTELVNPNFARMAEAVGVKGIRVEKPQELEGALAEALAHDGPALVDVVSARQELIMPPKTTIDEAWHFGVFMMKAVMDGRGSELIDLAKVNLTR